MTTTFRIKNTTVGEIYETTNWYVAVDHIKEMLCRQETFEVSYEHDDKEVDL